MSGGDQPLTRLLSVIGDTGSDYRNAAKALTRTVGAPWLRAPDGRRIRTTVKDTP